MKTSKHLSHRFLDILVAHIIFLSILLFSACGNTTTKVKPEYKSLVESVYASGNIVPKLEYRLFSMAEGYLTQKLISEGDEVKVGQKLFEIKSDFQNIRLDNSKDVLAMAQRNYSTQSPILQELRVSIENAKTKMLNDSVNYFRFKNLIENEATSKIEYDRSWLAYQNSKNEYQLQIARFEKTKNQLWLDLQNAQSNYMLNTDDGTNYALNSKINGLVYEVYKEEGETVRRGEAIALLGAKDAVYLKLDVDEQDIDKIQIGQEILVKIDVYKDKIFKAKVSKIYRMLNQLDQSFRVDAEFIGLMPSSFVGMTIEANVIVNKKPKALVIPKSVLIDEGSVIVLKNGKNEKVKIKKGIENYEEVEVLSGISEGDILVKK
jgi:HlyD family secretion protein